MGKKEGWTEVRKRNQEKKWNTSARKENVRIKKEREWEAKEDEIWTSRIRKEEKEC